jgi:hypothetical protein
VTADGKVESLSPQRARRARRKRRQEESERKSRKTEKGFNAEGAEEEHRGRGEFWDGLEEWPKSTVGSDCATAGYV